MKPKDIFYVYSIMELYGYKFERIERLAIYHRQFLDSILGKEPILLRGNFYYISDKIENR